MNCNDDFIKQQAQLLDALNQKQSEEKRSVSSSKNEVKDSVVFNPSYFASGKHSNISDNYQHTSKDTRNNNNTRNNSNTSNGINSRSKIVSKSKIKTESTSLSSMRSMYQNKSKK